MDKLVEMARKESIADIQTHARNTSIGFFYRLGFESTGKRLQHQDFSMHGITFQIVQMRITKE